MCFFFLTAIATMAYAQESNTDPAFFESRVSGVSTFLSRSGGDKLSGRVQNTEASGEIGVLDGLFA